VTVCGRGRRRRMTFLVAALSPHGSLLVTLSTLGPLWLLNFRPVPAVTVVWCRRRRWRVTLIAAWVTFHLPFYRYLRTFLWIAICL